MDAGARRVNKLTRGALARLVEAEKFAKSTPGDAMSLAFPTGMAAVAVDVVHMVRRPTVAETRKAGASLAKLRGQADLLVLAAGMRRTADMAFGLAMRDYSFDDHKTDAQQRKGEVVVMCAKPDQAQAAAMPLMAVAEGAFMTRDLTNAPANILTTTTFAEELAAMTALGLKVEVLDEDQLEELGMRPLALLGKGVVFDTGGISLKPGAGMEDMTMDMGGAGVVAGTMRALARRKAAANVVGLVGLVENMPSGNAIRPGDVITSMKGDTVEVINTDAEGRLVLCDVMWYAQERFKPVGMIDLATLTGAIIVGLGHENAGVFSNNDAFCNAFLKAAEAEGEGAWRMPLGQAYDDLLKSRIADMKNVGGRAAGSVTAAQFLQRFVKPETPWIHLDIAGVASVKTDTALAPKGATGWGVAALSRLILDQYEKV
jgi:leucyl aminopeptidase